MNKFYTYPKAIQWAVTIFLLMICFVLLGFWMKYIIVSFLYYFTFPLLAPVFQFCFTPFFTLIGLYKYLSPMLLVYSPSEKEYDLHNGTGFDYFFVMRGVKKGLPTQNKILEYYIEGVLKIIEEIEAGIIPPTITIKGTSYFFSESTARRLGFEIEPPTTFYKMNQYFNYIDLVWMYSRAKGRLAFPNMKNVKAVTIEGEKLMANREYLEKLYLYLKEKNTSAYEKQD